MKALILAAGRGSRMKSITDNKPKCLVEFNGDTILNWQTDALIENGINDISIIVGYRENLIPESPYKKIMNHKWNNTNMVYSLMCAKELLKEDGDLIISYSDIIYQSDVVKKLINTVGEIVVVVDKDWRKQWDLRFDNPISDAESLRISSYGNILDIGQKVKNLKEIEAQYIGLIKLTDEGKKQLLNYYQSLMDSGNDQKVNDNLYMTDLLFGLIHSDVSIKSCVIEGGWLEFDSGDDLDKYNDILNRNRLSEFIAL